jgi:hypothetical protein
MENDFKIRESIQIDEIQTIINELLDKSKLPTDDEYFVKQYVKLHERIIASKHGDERFLAVIDQNRSKLIDLHPQVFRLLSRIILALLDKLMERGVKSLIKEKKLPIINQIIILSQTFYKEKEENEERICLSEIINYHSIWGIKDIWEGIINIAIHEEIERQKSYKKTVTAYNKKLIVLTVLTTFKFNLKNFNVKCFNDILYKVGKKYKIEPEEIVDV